MRFSQKTFVLEFGHFVSDGGGRDTKAVFRVEGLGTNGLTGVGVFLDNDFDDLNLAIGKHRDNLDV